MIDTFSSKPVHSSSEGGFMLIEVLISAMLVVLIGVGVFTGLAGANHATVNERRNAQATVVAQQDEERLRGLPVEELTQIGSTTHNVAENGMCVEGSTGAWKYWNGAATISCEALTAPFKGATYTGAVFTVKSSAEFVTASKEALTCETEKGTTDYIETTSSVTWPSIGTHAPINQSSLVAVPKSGTLIVKVTNRNNEAVPGATVEAYDPATATTPTATETTPASGCVVFGDLAEGTAKAVASKEEWIAKNGKTKPESPSVTITTTKPAEASLVLQEPGEIEAKFVNSSNQPVESSTFVAHQNEMGSPPFSVGGEAGKVATSALLGKLFPFVTPGHPFTNSPYIIYAGDCEANKPAAMGINGAKEESVQVEPGSIPTTIPAQPTVEVAPVNVTVYEGESAAKAEKNLSTSTSAKIINTACKGVASQNYTTVPYEHSVNITSGTLVQKYQPYASALKLCVVGELGTTYYKNEFSLTNILKAGSAFTFYLKSSGYTKSTTAALTC
jgi:type II secretory pathway pseudopilin PulG